MGISVEFMAFIHRPGDLPRVSDHELDDNPTIQDFLISLGFERSELKMMQFFVSREEKTDSERKGKRYRLSIGDRLFVTIPIGGG